MLGTNKVSTNGETSLRLLSEATGAKQAKLLSGKFLQFASVNNLDLLAIDFDQITDF